MSIEKFRIEIPDQILTDLSVRLKNTKWSKNMDNVDWNFGTNNNVLKSVVDYWINDYD